MSYFIYILECADTSFYVGSTNNIEKRLHQHNFLKSGAHYTKIRRPVVLKYLQSVEDFSTARKREAELKRLSRAQKCELIASNSTIST